MSQKILLKNVFLQSRRASKLLDVKLCVAKLFIARAFYCTHDFEELQCKIKSGKVKSTVYPLIRIYGQPVEEALEFLDKNLIPLINRVTAYIVKPYSYRHVCNLVLSILGLEHLKQSLLKKYHFMSYRLYTMQIGSDDSSQAIKMVECLINKVPFQIYFHQIVTPETFNEFSKSSAKFLEEQVLSEFASPLIMWSHKSLWGKSLSKTLSQFKSDKVFDIAELSELESAISPLQLNYEDVLGNWTHDVNLDLLCSKLLSTELDGNFYHVAGFAVTNDAVCDEMKDIISFEFDLDDVDIDRIYLTIEDQILCLQLLPVNKSGQFLDEVFDLHENIAQSTFQFEEAYRRFITIEDRQFFAFVRNISEMEHSKLSFPHMRLKKNLKQISHKAIVSS